MRTEIMKTAIKLTYVNKEVKQHRTSEQIFEILYDLYPEIDEENIKIAANGAIEMHRSFMISVDEADGAGWSLKQLFNMTYLDLLSQLSTNHIRFFFDKPLKP